MTKLFLESITLQNFATFENQSIKIDKNFNAIIGETGSGKSLILDAFQLLLGARADKKLIRKDSEFTVIEGCFNNTNKEIFNFFDKLGFPYEGEVISIKRIIYKNGASKSFLNHQNCSLSILTTISKRFVDLVGQFENQKLLNANYQLLLLDNYGNLGNEVDTFKDEFQTLQLLERKIEETKVNIDNKAQRQDYLNYQIEQLSKINLNKDHELLLQTQKEKIIDQEKVSAVIHSTLFSLGESDNSIQNTLLKITKDINKYERFFDPLLNSKLNDANDLLEDISFDISKSLDEIDKTEVNLEDIIDELDLIQSLKRKFNVSAEGLIEKFEEFTLELKSLEQIDHELIELKKQHLFVKESCYQKASSIHQTRITLAEDLSIKMTNFIQKLNMKGASIKFSLSESNEIHKNGLSEIKFLVETNQGEGFHHIKEIASGGELSRILLGLRQIVSSNDSISIFFFDEIDTGIGGETAHKIAEALQEVSASSQVVAITHLAQIAKASNTIIHIEKKSIVSNKKTRTISIANTVKTKQAKELIKTLAGI